MNINKVSLMAKQTYHCSVTNLTHTNIIEMKQYQQIHAESRKLSSRINSKRQETGKS